MLLYRNIKLFHFLLIKHTFCTKLFEGNALAFFWAKIRFFFANLFVKLSIFGAVSVDSYQGILDLIFETLPLVK